MLEYLFSKFGFFQIRDYNQKQSCQLSPLVELEVLVEVVPNAKQKVPFVTKTRIVVIKIVNQATFRVFVELAKGRENSKSPLKKLLHNVANHFKDYHRYVRLHIHLYLHYLCKCCWINILCEIHILFINYRLTSRSNNQCLYGTIDEWAHISIVSQRYRCQIQTLTQIPVIGKRKIV